MFKIGIDVGGTFTDFVVAKEGEEPRYFKTSTTPHDPSDGIMAGLAEVAVAYKLSPETLLSQTDLVVHGTTVGTNVLVERKGAKVGLITTEGFRDILEIREGLKDERYNLRMKQVEPLVPRYLRIGVPERIRCNGTIEKPLDEAAVDKALEYLRDEGVEALAVCFLFSFVNPDHERRVGEKIRAMFPGMYTSLSHEVLPQIKEFDRVSTTVVNSYIGPVYGDYLLKLKERLASFERERGILIMQSNGGVAPLDDSAQNAVRAIFSGPAGGVAGAAHYGHILGQSKIIGFDMGGTSTDISLIEDGVPHIAPMRIEGGWKIAVPMIDVETLGAGGGSIARVDARGVLQVGPDSAGADPGPACYGQGGERPTVTDANLVLGYLDPENFLGGKRVLDKGLAEKAVKEHVAGPLGLATIDAARGIHQVVSTGIAEGIRRMSVNRGVDPRGFSILAFGGASGLQASAIARELGIDRVYSPPAAPVLSAYGMLSTDLKYDYSRSYPASLHSVDLNGVRALIEEMEAQGRKKLRTQGLSDEDVHVVRSVDMRYYDQIFEVSVPLPDSAGDDSQFLTQLESNFYRRYEELYSYHEVALEIRMVTLRLTVLGRLPRLAPPKRRSTGDDAAAQKGQRRVFLGDWREVPVYDSDGLTPGVEIEGPAIVESDFTTILVAPGDHARADAFGGIELSVALKERNGRDAEEKDEDAPDPITLAVIEHRLESIAIEMMEVMHRTAMSQLINSSRDFSTALLGADAQLVAQGEGSPVHTCALSPAVEAVCDFFGDDIAEGDIFVLNDPYFGGSHLPDITFVMPVYHDGKLRYFAVNRTHHVDIGGGTHGGYNPAATEIYQEGLRIPPVRIYDKGVRRDDIVHMFAHNVRHTAHFVGDINAQIGSVRVAARRIRELMENFGADRLARYVAEILDGTERQVRQMISAWPDGVYRGETLLDDDGFDSKLIPVRATVTIEGDHITIDLSESSPQVKGFVNSAYPNTRSVAHLTIMFLCPDDVAKNEGAMRPMTLIAPKGSIVNPNPPAPVTMGTNHPAEQIADSIFKALAPVLPDKVNCGFSRRLRYAIEGTDPRTGRNFIWVFMFARGGGGASEGIDGWSNLGENIVAGNMRVPSVEITEERCSLFVVRDEMRPDSGGDGTWRGGLGGICELIYEGDEGGSLTTAGDGVVVPPYGLFGGQPGQLHVYTLISNGTERVLRSKEANVPLKPGDRIVVLSSGGGGFGEPKKRSSEQRAGDLKNEYVTR